MKKFFYTVFAIFFNASRLLPVKKNRVSLLSPHRGGAHDSLMEVKRLLEEKGGYDIVYISTSQLDISKRSLVRSAVSALDFFFNKSRALATSEYVFLNDNFMPMASLKFSSETVITQLWHGEGAFKKFGLLTDLSDDIEKIERKNGKKLSYVVCTSENVAGIYAEAFGVEKEKVLALGSPRTDYIFRNNNSEKLRTEFDIRHPECKGKRLVLYAPTFRDSTEKDAVILSGIKASDFSRELGDGYSLLVKLHPQVHSAECSGDLINVTETEDIADLTAICDVVITDYSSVCMNFAYLSKPCIFYANDLDEYEHDRSFCFGFTDYIPGPFFDSFDDVIAEIKNPRSTDKLSSFRNFNFDYVDCCNTQRVLSAIITNF